MNLKQADPSGSADWVRVQIFKKLKYEKRKQELQTSIPQQSYRTRTNLIRKSLGK
jgi:hypothetical protein